MVEIDNSDADGDASVLTGWQYISELLTELEKFDSELLRGRDRFTPKNELRYAPAQFRSILAVANALMKIDRAFMPSDLGKRVEAALADLLKVADGIASLPAEPGGRASSAAREENERARRRLREILSFFSTVVEPIVEEARAHSRSETGEAATLSADEIADIRRTREELEESRTEFADLKARHAEISAELEARKELIEAARAQTGSEGAKDLASAYEDQARDHGRQWKIWGLGLILATLAALVGSYAVLHGNRPQDDATTAQIVSHLATDLLLIGLLIFVVRVTSRQFSVHRHLATVAHNKAAALMTFARIVSSGSSAEARDRLTDVLAQSVFVSDNTGFLDASGDQVTLPERLAGPIGQRFSQG